MGKLFGGRAATLAMVAAVPALSVTAQAVGADGGGDMQVPVAASAVGAIGACGGLAAAAAALLRRQS
jgi:hypothetical protein